MVQTEIHDADRIDRPETIAADRPWFRLHRGGELLAQRVGRVVDRAVDKVTLRLELHLDDYPSAVFCLAVHVKDSCFF